MPETILERGIGEIRRALVDDGAIVETRVLVEGIVPSGRVLQATLTNGGRQGRNAVARAGSDDYLLPGGAPGITEGGRFDIVVTRERIPGGEAWKRPLAKPAEVGFVGNANPDLADAVPDRDRLGSFGWDDLLAEAREGIVGFEGGELRVSLTPAMTLIDVDGTLPAEDLALAGAQAAARAIRRHGIGGSIGIDLPTVGGKAVRQAIGEAIDRILPKPFERTAVNGFGFVQVVRPRTHASLFELAADRAAFEARALLRSAGRHVGAIRLAAHPAVVAEIEAHPGWIEMLGRQVGGAVGLRADARIAIAGGHVEEG